MLRSFRVSNHKSFRDEAELLLLPAYDKSRPVVPVAAIFGANASGKSNLVDALRWLQTAVRQSYAQWEPGAGIPRTPFRLDPDAAARPSVYCVELLLDGRRYTYGLEVDAGRVLAEWLYTYPHNRRRVIFDRDRDTIRLGSTLPDHRTRGQQLASQTRGNALFLSVAAHNHLEEVQAAYHWFRAGVRFVDGDKVAEGELLRRLRDVHQRSALVELIGAADLGISDVISNEEEIAAFRAHARNAMGDQETQEEVLKGVLVELFPGMLEKIVLPQVIPQLLGDDRFRTVLLEKIDASLEGPTRGSLRFRHGAGSSLLALEDQSAGTKSWIGLISDALDVIGSEDLMIVDEVDASLHPHLSARLINLFRDPETNPGGAQLLLTTHDATLLDEGTLSRDEIWFVEKDPDSGASRLYPLTDYRPRKNEDREGRYLAGSYGAVPVLSDHKFRRALASEESADAAA